MTRSLTHALNIAHDLAHLCIELTVQIAKAKDGERAETFCRQHSDGALTCISHMRLRLNEIEREMVERFIPLPLSEEVITKINKREAALNER